MCIVHRLDSRKDGINAQASIFHIQYYISNFPLIKKPEITIIITIEGLTRIYFVALAAYLHAVLQRSWDSPKICT